MRLAPTRLCFVLALFAFALSSCASAPLPTLDARFPFHVAVAPVDVLASDAAGPVPGEDEFALRFESERVTRELAAQLDPGVFTRVSVLALPEGQSAADFQALEATKRERYLIDAARAVGADLLLETDLRFTPAIEHRAPTVNAWVVTVPTWLFLGPVSWLVGDRKYQARATLAARLRDLSALDRAQPSDRLDVLTDFLTEFESSSYNFVERADSVTSYCWTLIVPPAWASRETDGLQERLTQDVLDELTRGVAKRIAAETERVVVAEDVAECFVAPKQVVAERYADGVVRIAGPIYERRVKAGEYLLQSLEVMAGDRAWERTVDGDPTPAESVAPGITTRALRYDVDSAIAGFDRDVDTLRVRLREIGIGQTRTFTLPIAEIAANYTPTADRPVEVSYLRGRGLQERAKP